MPLLQKNLCDDVLEEHDVIGDRLADRNVLAGNDK